VTPADIAPTLAALTGVTLATRDGRVLAEALKKPAKKITTPEFLLLAPQAAPDHRLQNPHT